MNRGFWLLLSCLAGTYAVACSSTSNGGTQGPSSGSGGHTTTTNASSSSGTTTTTASSSGTGGTGGTTTTSSSSSTSSGASSTSSSSSSTSSSSGCSSGTPVTLTVKNFDSWCKVSVNGGTAAADAVQTVCVAANGTVPVTATPASSSFELGPDPWHDTTGDTGPGDPGTVSGGVSSTTATVTTGTKCVWACCPFTNGTGCPATDQCP